MDLVGGGQSACGETPLQNLFVASTLGDTVCELAVVHAQESRAAMVEAFAQARVICLRQFAFRVSFDLIEHSPEIDDATDFRGGTSDR